MTVRGSGKPEFKPTARTLHNFGSDDALVDEYFCILVPQVQLGFMGNKNG